MKKDSDKNKLSVEVSSNISLKADPETFTGEFLQVRVYDNNVERAIRLLRAKVQRDRVLSLYKESREYEKPSDKKRRKINESKRKVLQEDSFKDVIEE